MTSEGMTSFEDMVVWSIPSALHPDLLQEQSWQDQQAEPESRMI